MLLRAVRLGLLVAGVAAAARDRHATSSAPAAWRPRIAGADMAFAPDDASTNPTYAAIIGNGFLSSQHGSNLTFVSGLFNGYLGTDPSHRAALAGTSSLADLQVARTGAKVVGAGLDFRRAAYYRRTLIAPEPTGACDPATFVTCTTSP